MIFATKPGASIQTVALSGVPCAEFAVSFHTIVVLTGRLQALSLKRHVWLLHSHLFAET